jgi:hypothetical protein
MKVVFPSPLSPTTIIVKAAPLGNESISSRTKQRLLEIIYTPLCDNFMSLVRQIGNANELIDVSGNHSVGCSNGRREEKLAKCCDKESNDRQVSRTAGTEGRKECEQNILMT